MRASITISALFVAGLAACLGTTGSTIVHFAAAAAGPPDASVGKPLAFTSGLGWAVVLTKATLHVGAIYLDQTLPSSGGGASPCVLPGTYVAQVTTDPGGTAGIDVDLLSPLPQYFPNPGQGTDLPAKAGQVWLTGVEVDIVDDPTTILHVEGTAQKAGSSVPFTGNVTIGQNRLITPSDASKPGSNPICRQRIVSPIPVDLTPRNSGTLLLRIDPRPLFVDIDFSALKAFSNSPPSFGFVDAASDEPSSLLYSALRSAGSIYQFSWDSAGN